MFQNTDTKINQNSQQNIKHENKLSSFQLYAVMMSSVPVF